MASVTYVYVEERQDSKLNVLGPVEVPKIKVLDLGHIRDNVEVCQNNAFGKASRALSRRLESVSDIRVVGTKTKNPGTHTELYTIKARSLTGSILVLFGVKRRFWSVICVQCLKWFVSSRVSPMRMMRFSGIPTAAAASLAMGSIGSCVAIAEALESLS